MKNYYISMSEVVADLSDQEIAEMEADKEVIASGLSLEEFGFQILMEAVDEIRDSIIQGKSGYLHAKKLSPFDTGAPPLYNVMVLVTGVYNTSPTNSNPTLVTPLGLIYLTQ